MEYRTFGKTGKRISVFTLGTMRFRHGWDPPFDQLPDDSLEHAHRIITTALEAGFNLIETARGYGKSERLIGRTLPQLSQTRESYHLMTKAPPAASGAEMRRILEESLQRLGVDSLDFFGVHGINTLPLLELTCRKGGAMSALEQAREE